MNKKDLNTIYQAMNCLMGQKLQYFMRAGAMGDLGFGDYVERETHQFDENKKLIPVVDSVPRYILHIDTPFRLVCGCDIILANGDMFQPSYTKENEVDFNWSSFNWDVNGNNRFDEIVKNYFGDDPGEFTVKKIMVNKFGDLKIEFEKGFILETFTNVSGSEECWRFFEIGSDKHDTVITGQGLEADDGIDELNE